MTANDAHDAATNNRILAAVIHAAIAGDLDEVLKLTDPIDPIECLALAAVLDTEAMLRKVGLASLPETPHVRVTHAGDNWSRKAPCA